MGGKKTNTAVVCQDRIWMAVTQTGSRGAAGCPGHTHLKHKHSQDCWRLGTHRLCVCVCVHSCLHRAANTGQCQTLRGRGHIVCDVVTKWHFAIPLFSIRRKCVVQKLPKFQATLPSQGRLILKIRATPITADGRAESLIGRQSERTRVHTVFYGCWPVSQDGP